MPNNTDALLAAALAAKAIKKAQQALDRAQVPGPQGPQGECGPAGEDGRDGRDGNDGATGPVGLQGPRGERGEVGPQGPQGLPGERGEDGRQGERGPVGPQGDTGERGEQGPQGVPGAAGLDGKTPDHEWVGTALRFEKPDGTWGELVNLKGKDGAQGPQGSRGPTGGSGSLGDIDTPPAPAPSSAELRMHTTRPLRVSNGQLTLPSMPLGDVVWNQALVYLDLTPSDLDGTGALRGDRNYLVEEHVVRTEGRVVHFVSTAPDGLHAVVSYLGTAYD